MSLTPGSRLGPYEILDLIGAGGMGEVWKAHDTRLGRTVVLVNFIGLLLMMVTGEAHKMLDAFS